MGSSRARRIVFLNRFFHPDHSATSQILSDLAFYLAERGECVHVIASRQLYDDEAAKLPVHETVRGVRIHRVATTQFGRGFLPGRAFDYLSFYLTAAWKLLRIARRNDIVVTKTDPPMLSVLAASLGWLRGFRRVNWLQDLYPEIAAELGLIRLGGIFGRGLVAIRDASLRGAACNVAVGEGMADLLRRRGVPASRLRVISNWTDDEAIVPSDAKDNPLRQAWALTDKFVIAYSGNLGRAHDIETLLDAAERLRTQPNIVFLFVGGGHGLRELQHGAPMRRLTNIVLKPYQPRTLLSQSLAVADIHWLSLKAGFDGLLLPSKFYGIAAAGRPIVVVGSPGGELGELVKSHACGFAVASGDGEALARIFAALAGDPDDCRRLGQNARQMLEKLFTKTQALERWHGVLRSVADGHPADRPG